MTKWRAAVISTGIYRKETGLDSGIIRKMFKGRVEPLHWICLVLYMSSDVQGGPQGQYFITEPQDVTGIAGDHLMLGCGVANMEGRCQWTKNGFRFGTDPDLPGYPRLTMDTDRLGDCNLHVFPVLPEDEGEYACQVGGVLGMAAIMSDTARVMVIAPPGLPYIKQAKLTDTLNVLEGEEVVLDCETTGAKPAAEVQWKDQNGKRIIANLLETVHKIARSKTFKTVSTMRMQPRENMNLTCSAFSDAFTEPRNSRKLKIMIKHSPRISLNITNEGVTMGQTIVVKCGCEAYPSNVTYKWFLNDDATKETSDMFTIENVSKELNNAVLTCEAENSVGKSKVSKVLNVNFVSQILTHPASEISKYGEKVKLSCLAEGNPAPSYVWVKGKTQEIVGVSENLVLTATDDTEDDYNCKVFVDGEKTLISETASIRILRKPSVFTESVKHAKICDDVILQCRVESLSNNTKVTWTKNDKPIDREQVKHRVLHTDNLYQFASDLIIYNVQEDDFTNYGCFSSNEVGTDYKVFPLEKEEDKTEYISMALSINTIVGVIILVFIIIHHKRKNREPERIHIPEQLQRQGGHEVQNFQREILPPIYRGDDPTVFQELLLDRRMHEDNHGMGKEYFNNKCIIKERELRID